MAFWELYPDLRYEVNKGGQWGAWKRYSRKWNGMSFSQAFAVT